ncbi:MAG TPA: hypothetical protein VFR76_08810, partial [Verrucomicrobiae bacterium]|nr:hypothetical protein [Verrucomicrobiae bacterium]
PLELTDAFLCDFQFTIVVNHGQPSRRVRLILATDSSASDSELYRLIALGWKANSPTVSRNSAN